ncbi:MAG: gliding motility-associated ABC transporter substrate-binding protein GldG [Bacteroidetes bacterium]|nr:gliding motility-associated ABC transporter substrate-binding protein GldG [Bacteroidota bacterium]
MNASNSNTVKRQLKKQNIIRLILAVTMLILVNVISGFVFTRMDLTAEKRFSLAPSTKELLKKLDDVIYVKIYLDGELPPGFKRLRNSTRELLDEFRVYAGNNIEYEFIDPNAIANKEERNKLYQQLSKKGLEPTNLEERQQGGTSQKIIFPGAILNYRAEEIPLQLLKSQMGSGSEQMLNNSIEGLEYDFIKGIKNLTSKLKTRIAFLQGHGELNTKQITDAARALQESYKVDTVSIHGKLDALKNIKTLIIAKPDSAFSEKDKFIIDQFIMNGGRVLWLMDAMQINIDSLAVTSTNVAIAKELNLDDQLFRYGVRINYDLLMDMQAAPIPVVTGQVGNQPKTELFPWYFSPLINPTSLHPVVRNLNAIKLDFASTIDTIEAAGIQKTFLLFSSEYSKAILAPVRVSLNILKEKPDPKQFNKSHLPVAVLLEGSFTSNFKNRIPETIANDPAIGFHETGTSSKMIVVSDGDVAESYVSRKGTIYPLGYDRFTGQTYGNRNFILNCVDYLCDDSGLMSLRAKEIKLRLLDKAKTENSSVKWLNTLLPVLLIVLYGIFRTMMRKRKFERN